MTSQSKKSFKNVRPASRRTPGEVFSSFIGIGVMSIIAGILVTAAVTPVVAITAVATGATINIFENLPGHINPGKVSLPSAIWAKRGEEKILLARFYAQNRKTVGWDEISQYAKDAAVSEEDPRFYSHGGVDVLSAARAAVQNVLGTSGSGASTITMQYVRNLLVQEAELIQDEEERKAAYKRATEVDFGRKLKEMRLAIAIEKNYTKNEILLGYLNIANFGGRIYGIESAANTYYGKSAKDLTLAESASLVGIVNYPSALNLYSPKNYEANKKRRDRIISSMLREGKITQAQHDEAVATPIEPKITETPSGCTIADKNFGLGHFCDYVTRYLQQDPKFGKTPAERWWNFQNGGYDIITTVDLALQETAFKTTRRVSPMTARGINYGSAATTVENRTGRVLAMVQNRPFSDDQDFLAEHPEYTAVNYNTDYEYGGSRGFQYGSVVKAFTLAEWIRAGHSVNEMVNVSAREVKENSFSGSCLPGGVYGQGSFSFKNWTGFSGNRTVLYALDQSINGGFVSMAQKTDLCNIFQIAEKMGVKRAAENPNREAPNYNSRNLAIVPSGVYNGNDEVSPIRLASAYAGFSSEGMVCTPVPIDTITNAAGDPVDFTKSTCRQAIEPRVANGTLYALEHYVNHGLGRAARSNAGIARMGKTGSTDDNKDRWWVGGSTKVTTAVWTGNVTGFVDLQDVGLYRVSDYIFDDITDLADRIYKGDPFPKPDAAALNAKQEIVPNVAGQPVEEAKTILTAAGFDAQVAPEPVDSTLPKDTVAETDPAGGSNATTGATITLKISSGKPPQPVLPEIPSGLNGQTAQAATNQLSSLGFSNVFMQCERAGRPTATLPVKSVTPAPGTKAEPNTRILLILNC